MSKIKSSESNNYNYLTTEKREEFQNILNKNPEELKKYKISDETITTFKRIRKFFF